MFGVLLTCKRRICRKYPLPNKNGPPRYDMRDMAVFMLGTSLKPLKSKLICGPLDADATAM